MTRSIDTLLVANRGEIACRVMRTAKSLGLTTVAVHSAVDANARHAREADIKINLGGAKPAESYLLADKIIAAAKAAGAQAIHPGYGFLSENASFAQAIADAGLIFLGPPASAIIAMGSKSAAKALMETAGVPLVPGYHGDNQDYETFREAAQRIGYPVLLKATAGGGGKGMKVVEKEADLKQALESAQREAQSSFGDPKMLVEKYVLKPRHVEIQIFADEHGNCIYLNERDCSIQRRHQKVVEEAPAPGLTLELRQAMGESAVRAAQAIGYVGAGTVEFLLDARGEFFFMEMNTRLQVEHPVTELITGQDLVAWQIRIARGEKLPLTQDQVPLNGHAIEVRLYAEDPDNDFLPATGTLDLYREASAGEGRRIDSGIEQGDSISPFYDPMISKLIAWGSNREEARQRLLAMLADTQIAGVRTNLAFLSRILAHPAFAKAELDTGFIERHTEQLFVKPSTQSAHFWKLAAAAWALSEPKTTRQDDPNSPWANNCGLRIAQPRRFLLHLACGEEQQKITLREADLAGVCLTNDRLILEQHGQRTSHSAIRQGNTLYLELDGQIHSISAVDSIALAEAAAHPQGGLTAPMNGSIVRVLVSPEQQVAEGDVLVVLEAMKMEHSIRAPHAGTVQAIFCSEGEMVSDGMVLVEITGDAA
ncbi:acetyl/propionyl/methylcrotonyl-CoA carboxylase subunit alpha [Pseudomonas sp. F1_0610]|uniref:acetyl-CoA carboxylase biotin carboxylase subunit n=1 Tax=Pseudomonas sp. F1_0610 TaxID=3114284 RepID=UPI0039C25750